MVKSNAGVTLVELAVVMVVSVIVTTAAYGIYGYFMKTIAHSSRFTSSEQGAYQKLGMLSSTFRRSQAILKLTPEEISYRDSQGDTLSLIYREDTLYRRFSESEITPWFTLDSLKFTQSEDSLGWVNCTLSCSYPGQFENFHTIKQTVVIYRETEVLREEDWGF